MPDKIYLRQMQALPLRAKVVKSQLRIKEWYQHFDGDVCISFSGGKDSTVLATLVHDMYPDVPMVFCNTGLEYPEIQEFARRMGAEFVRPKMRFDEVISKYGYPIISKENAEAIYYARKILNSDGGGYNLIQRQNRLEKSGVAWQNQNGLTESTGRNAENCLVRTETEQKRREFPWGGGMTDTHRKRAYLQNLRNEYNQERGNSGEETPLPG